MFGKEYILNISYGVEAWKILTMVRVIESQNKKQVVIKEAKSPKIESTVKVKDRQRETSQSIVKLCKANSFLVKLLKYEMRGLAW